jgi:ureidoglycolate lyase
MNGKYLYVEALSRESFNPFGSFQAVSCEGSVFTGEYPIRFYRDLAVQTTDSTSLGWSICQVKPREFAIDTAEFHSRTSEGLMPLNGDMLFFVAPAVPAGHPFPVDKVRVFHVPQYTTIIIRPGVWHHAPFAINSEILNVLVLLPERTYANDCHIERLSDEGRLKLEYSSQSVKEGPGS